MKLAPSSWVDRYNAFTTALQDLLVWAGIALVIIPAVSVFPRNVVLRIADGLGVIVSLSPAGLRTYWVVRAAFNLSRWNALKLSAQCHARVFLDCALTRRIDKGLDDPDGYPFREVNSDKVDALAKTGESFIVVTGHFARAATPKLFHRCIRMGHLIPLMRVPPEISGSLFERLSHLRSRIQYRTLTGAFNAGKGRGTYELIVLGADTQPLKTLMRRMKNPGNVSVIFVDAPWQGDARGAFSRPFAGDKERVFALGAARLARSSGCALVTCYSWFDDDDSLVLEWGDPIRIERDDTEGERKIMDKFLDQIERNVGERPSQYVLPIGMGRYWDYESKTWMDTPN